MSVSYPSCATLNKWPHMLKRSEHVFESKSCNTCSLVKDIPPSIATYSNVYRCKKVGWAEQLVHVYETWSRHEYDRAYCDYYYFEPWNILVDDEDDDVGLDIDATANIQPKRSNANECTLS